MYMGDCQMDRIGHNHGDSLEKGFLVGPRMVREGFQEEEGFELDRL